MNKADELRVLAGHLDEGFNDTAGDICRRAADREDQMAGALQKIVRRSRAHPDDTDADRRRDLFHVRAEAERALRAAGYEVSQ